jgi:hypothetical protein
MKQGNKIKIYWAPFIIDKENDWSILQYNPENLFERFKNNLNRESIKKPGGNLIMCPSVKNYTNKIFIFKNTLQSYFEIKENNTIIPVSKNYITAHVAHESSLKNCMLMIYNVPLIFFSEADVNMTVTSPYFSNSPHLKYGAIVPGKFNISKWFRNINIEFNLWQNVKELKIEKDEDLFYVNFDCEEEVELVRFDLTERLIKIAIVAGNSSIWEKLIPLKDRYERFKKSQMHKIVIKEIKKNII